MAGNNSPYVNEHSEDEELHDSDHPDSEVCRLLIIGIGVSHRRCLLHTKLVT